MVVRRSERRQDTNRNVLSNIKEDTCNRSPIQRKTVTALAGKSKQDSCRSKVDQLDLSNAHQLKAFVQDIEDQVNIRKNEVLSEAAQNVKKLESMKKARMMKIAKTVRNMSLKEYNETQGEHLEWTMFLTSEQTINIKSSANSQSKYNTPARPADCIGFGKTRVATSVLRNPKARESIFSKNGSPLGHQPSASNDDGIFCTVKKRRSNQGTSIISSLKRLDIDVGNNTFINIKDPSTVCGLDAKMKERARKELKILSDQISGLMAGLGK
mmetsp:Transcript_23926/g.27562  ORF Transcript_23926/g.27562 Transcript_23926/m.27562 type:complete len:269 (+) Transcript_23926:39-845(+)